jgi:hypothetical protein
VVRSISARNCSPYRFDGPVLTTITPAPVAMKPVLMMLQPLAGEKSALAPSTTHTPGASRRAARP